jgi:hypothetical protein
MKNVRLLELPWLNLGKEEVKVGGGRGEGGGRGRRGGFLKKHLGIQVYQYIYIGAWNLEQRTETSKRYK